MPRWSGKHNEAVEEEEDKEEEEEEEEEDNVNVLTVSSFVVWVFNPVQSLVLSEACLVLARFSRQTNNILTSKGSSIGAF